MPPRLRKFVLTTHLAVSVGWIGAVVAYLALAVAAWTRREAATVRTAWVGLEVIGWYILVPSAVGSLVTGLVLALGTRWGVFQHYWVLFSLLLTSLAAAVLVGHLPTVSSYATIARAAASPGRVGLQGELLHAGGGLLVLLVIAGLNVYKPPGLTPYGRRKRRERLADSRP
jgi:hypothetical protein